MRYGGGHQAADEFLNLLWNAIDDFRPDIHAMFTFNETTTITCTECNIPTEAQIEPTHNYEIYRDAKTTETFAELCQRSFIERTENEHHLGLCDYCHRETDRVRQTVLITPVKGGGVIILRSIKISLS